MNKRLALLLHHAGTAPNLIYPSLQKMIDVEVVTFFIKSKTNKSLNDLYDKVIGTIGPGVECANEEDMFIKVIEYNKNNPINGVLTFAEMLLSTASRVTENIGIKYMDVTTINNIQNKFLQRKILKDAGVLVPNFFEIKSEKDLQEAGKLIGFPSVLKPNFGGGGYGIIKVNNYEELVKSYKYEQNNYENIILENVESSFTLEELMTGENWNENEDLADYCSVESIVQNGEITHISVSDRTKLIPPFRESGFTIPSTLCENKQLDVKNMTSKALIALNVNNTMVHTEIKFTKQGPKIIEVNGRPGGTVPFQVFNATNGEYDLFLELAKLSLGEKINTNIEFKKHTAGKVSHCPEGKWLIKSINFENIKNVESLTLSIPIKKEGEVVNSYRGIEDLLALYYLENADPKKLVSDMYKIDSLLEVNYEKL